MENLLLIIPLLIFALIIVMLASMWIIYKKAGQ